MSRPAPHVVNGRREGFANGPRPQATWRIYRGVDIPAPEVFADERLVASEHEDVEVAMLSRLAAQEQVDGPPAGDPPRHCPRAELGSGLVGPHRVPRPEFLACHGHDSPNVPQPGVNPSLRARPVNGQQLGQPSATTAPEPASHNEGYHAPQIAGLARRVAA